MTSYYDDTSFEQGEIAVPAPVTMRRTISLNKTMLFFMTVAGVRLIGMWAMPLADVTEARYGEIARKMVQTGDWITLWHDYGVPFWAKPPLSTWLSALSMKAFGINEFAARLPALLLAVGVLFLVWRFSRNLLRGEARWLPVIFLGSMALFYVESGTVTTDMVLLFSITLSLVSFWFAVAENNRKWGYILFAALGTGLLAKGPVAVVLALLPIFFWLIWTRSWKRMAASLPWRGGLALTSLIALPWYIAAEIKTPGFLHYFIVGEHIKRFLVPSWKGDLYGYAHQHAPGTIWLFLLLDALPWVLVLVALLIAGKARPRNEGVAPPGRTARDQWKYLWCWFLVPLLFFTLARNITRTYALPALPALAIIISCLAAPVAISKGAIRKWVYGAGLLSPAVLLIVMISIQINPDLGQKSSREISHLFRQTASSGSDRLSYVGKRLYSMDFYNSGQAQRFASIAQAFEAARPDRPLFLALTNQQAKSIDKSRYRLKLVASTRRYQLYKAGLEGKNE